MARKKPKKQNEQQKRLRVTDEAGWTHIIKGSRAQRHQRHVSLNESLEPTEPPDGLTVDKMKEKFEKFCRHWKESESFGIFKLMLEEGLLACEKVNLTRCVCLGLGSLGGRDASMYELVFLYTALEILGKKHEITDVYFQDPVFNTLDEAFLESLGYTICKTPDAFGKVTPTTFVFAPHLEIWSCAMALEASPQLYVGNDIEATIEKLDRQGGWRTTSNTFKQYMNVTVSKPMADFDRNNWTYSTCVYWPRRSDDGAGYEIEPSPVREHKDISEIDAELDRLYLELKKP